MSANNPKPRVKSDQESSWTDADPEWKGANGKGEV